MKFVALCAILCLLIGCEPWLRPTEFAPYGNPQLVAVAEQVEPELEQAFDATITHSVSFEYGQWSEIRGLDITIVPGLSPANEREHVRHELTHIIAGLNVCVVGNGDAIHPQWINGVEAIKIVPSWKDNR